MKPAVDTAQTTWELEQLLFFVREQSPSKILEIGIWEGGTLWHWLENADTVVAIDDTMRPPGPDVWHVWAADAGTRLKLFHGDSHDLELVASVRERGPYDFIFIDGDHSYDSVKADWRNYRPMLAEGGLLAFHDITPRPDYGVHQLWQEIKAEPDTRTVEIVENSGRFNGIGLVFG